MYRSALFTRGACVSALVLMSAAPALAEGKGDRAQLAIAQAQAKIDTADTVGAAGDVPGIVAHAKATLATAQEEAKSGHKERAISDANSAAGLADTAIGEAQKSKDAAAAAQTSDAQAVAASAQQDAAAANARADAAQASARDAAAQAEALRNAPPPPPAAPPPTQTVVVEKEVVHTPAPSRVVHRRRVVHHVVHHAAPAATVTEKTTVTTHN